MRRLAIIDLKSGQQPIHNQDRTAWIVFNGEIYNYRELREQLESSAAPFYTNSDTEAIVHAYDQYGTDCPKYLRGMFAFAIWDERTQDAFSRARSRRQETAAVRAGQRPARLWIRVQRAAPASGRQPRHRLRSDSSLSFVHVRAGAADCLSGDSQARAGTFAAWSKRRDQDSSVTGSPIFRRRLTISEEEAGERVVDLLRDAVRVRLMSEVPLGAFLSGGIDSSAVVALMAEESTEPVKTFSIGFEEQDFSELHHARRVAEHVGADHHEFIVRPDAMEILPTLVEHYGEPYADSSAIPSTMFRARRESM